MSPPSKNRHPAGNPWVSAGLEIARTWGFGTLLLLIVYYDLRESNKAALKTVSATVEAMHALTAEIKEGHRRVDTEMIPLVTTMNAHLDEIRIKVATAAATKNPNN
jgi:hypothetical protein